MLGSSKMSDEHQVEILDGDELRILVGDELRVEILVGDVPQVEILDEFPAALNLQ